jgi:hypothetical protein
MVAATICLLPFLLISIINAVLLAIFEGIVLFFYGIDVARIACQQGKTGETGQLTENPKVGSTK